jgi:putative oxidoreductase
MNESCGTWRDRALHIGLLLLRITMGLAIAYHGYMKVFGGQRAMLEAGLVQWAVPAPALLSWLASLSEFLGGLLIAVGLGTRIAAFFVFFTMSVAFFKAHGADPWQVKELAFLFGTIALSLIFTGGGWYSLDMLCCCRSCKVEPKAE